jgi:hypothetical protein
MSKFQVFEKLADIPLIPNPDKPEQIATKAPRHKAKPLVNIHLCVFVSWWRKCFDTKCKKIISKVLKILKSHHSSKPEQCVRPPIIKAAEAS